MRTIALIRHAEKDHQSVDKDPGLSRSGLQQAKLMGRYFASTWKDKVDVRVFASPKRRCVDTGSRIAEALKIEVQSLKELDERIQLETPIVFALRVERILESLLKGSLGTHSIIVSHADWLDEFCSYILGSGTRLTGLGAATMHLLSVSDKKLTLLQAHVCPK